MFENIFKKRWGTLLLSLIFLFSFFTSVQIGTASYHNMEMEISGCMFMQHTKSICPMGLDEHLGAWQQLFLALPILLSLAIIVFFVFRYLSSLFESFPTPRAFFTLAPQEYRARAPNFHTWNWLFSIFSAGIIKSQIYLGRA